MVTATMKLKTLAPWKKSYNQPRQHIRKQRHYFANKGPSSQGFGFSNRCESWTVKKVECRRTDAFELWCWRRLLRVPWSARRTNQSILKETVLNIHWKDWCWSWNSNALVTWCDHLNWLIWKDPDAGKDWKQEKGMTEDETVGWHHWLDGHEFE